MDIELRTKSLSGDLMCVSFEWCWLDILIMELPIYVNTEMCEIARYNIFIN